MYVELEENAQAIGQLCLQYLSVLKREKPGSGSIASAGNDLQKSIRSLGRLAGVRTCRTDSMAIIISDVGPGKPVIRGQC